MVCWLELTCSCLCPSSQHQPAAASATKSKVVGAFYRPLLCSFSPLFPDHCANGACLCHADPIPAFSLEVNPFSKSFTITVDVADYPVHARWCYRNGSVCNGNNSFQSGQSQSAILRFPFLLPCVCVEVVPPLDRFMSAMLVGRFLRGLLVFFSRCTTVTETPVVIGRVRFCPVLLVSGT